MHHLVIVESPGKIKKIQEYLSGFAPPSASSKTDSPNDDKHTFKVVSSYGHVRDLPRNKINVDPENGWEANYQPLADKQKTIASLRKEAKKADQIYLATDLDREGEAIAWHLREMIGGEEEKFNRVVFNEITKSAIQEAFSEQGRIDIDRVNAQQARRFLDRVVGYKLSPVLWSKVARNLSAGRVQSVAVRLIVEREREIRAFHPEEFWDVNADLEQNGSKEARTFQVIRHQGKKFDIPNQIANHKSAEQVETAVREADLVVSSVRSRNTTSAAAAPFITSTLQQAASTRFGYSVRNTMSMAQVLYEAGLITYMRTDSTSVSAESQNAAAELIKKDFGDDYIPEKPNTFKTGSGAQEAHEAIRPSDVSIDLGKLDQVKNTVLRTKDLRVRESATRLYELIWRRFIASQMSRARYENTTITVKADDYELSLSGRRTLFAGHTAVAMTTGSKEDEVDLPQYREGETLNLLKTDKKQHFTKPPPRYNEARLVRELEKRGIGRPSTYASIISTIKDRGYVSSKGKRLYAERIGEVVTDGLVDSFSNLLSYEFTADLEKRLDDVSIGKEKWKSLLNEYYGDFSLKLAKAESNPERWNNPIPTEIACSCEKGRMAVRIGSTGIFLGCEQYPECRHTLNLVNTEEIVESNSSDDEQDDEEESKRLLNKRLCDFCQSSMEPYRIDDSQMLHLCGNSNCTGHHLEFGDFALPKHLTEGPTVNCNVCTSDMERRDGRFGPYFGCSNDECKNTRKIIGPGPSDVAAPPIHMSELEVEDEDDHYVLREGKAGIFLGASKYPKVRKIRSPRIKELKVHANEIDPKFQYLLSAPDKDDDSNDTFVKFSRKSREHFLVSMKADKQTGWRSFYKDGYWQSADRKAPKVAKK